MLTNNLTENYKRNIFNNLISSFNLFFKIIFMNIIMIFSRDYFCFIINFYCLLKNKKIKFFYSNENNCYFYHDSSYDTDIYFYHKKRAFSYVNGLIHRIDVLENAYFINNIEFRDGDCIIDCGANIGEIFHVFASKRIPLHYTAFEPSPEEFRMIELNTQSEQQSSITCVLHNFGLWNQDCIIRFYQSGHDADSSIIEPSEFDGTIEVQAKRLSTMLNGRVRLLKLEAEGAEPEVLEGIGEKIHLIDYISADLGFERGKSNDSTLVPVVNFLLERGFVLEQLSYPRITALFRNKSVGF